MCYFLLDESYNGDCTFTNIFNGNESTAKRPLDEFSTLIRYNNAVNIIHKILKHENNFSSIDSIVIQANGINSERAKSKYNNQTKYKSGTILPKDDFLLLAFAKLDEYGNGYITHDEYIDCLMFMWKEIDKHYAKNDVCIPILGAGTTRTGDGNQLTQQELLDIIIGSYKICGNKIKRPNKLIIVCRKYDDFSINNIMA